MKLFRSLTKSPIESLSALVLVAVGVYISSIGSTATSDKTGLLAAGGLLTTFGGVLFAWVVSKTFTTEHARVEFQQQLGHLSRNLGQAAGQISRAVEQSQTKDIAAETGLALISQANRIIYGQVSEISVIQGTGFDPAYLLETATTLDHLARQLESDGEVSGELEEVRRQLKEVRTSLSSATPTRTYSSTPTECPHCKEMNEVRLGDTPGDTASAACASCGERFNAHRASDGSAFSRALGPAPRSAPTRKVASWAFDCPACGRRASTRQTEGEKTMVCFGCYKPLEVDLSNREVRIGAGEFQLSTPPIAGRLGSRPMVKCPKCRREVNAFLVVDGDFVGVCYDDLQVMRVSRADFEDLTGKEQKPSKVEARGSLHQVP
jgi:transcription elongation factor Elf1